MFDRLTADRDAPSAQTMPAKAHCSVTAVYASSWTAVNFLPQYHHLTVILVASATAQRL